MGANSARSSKGQLGHGIMSGASSLAHTDLALPPSAPPSLGHGGDDGRSVSRGVSACCESRMHCAHLHGCAHPTFTYHQCTVANTTHKLHWHACTRGHMHACAPVILPHAFTRWCGCAMGTGPKQAVAHVTMPVMNVGNPSK